MGRIDLIRGPLRTGLLLALSLAAGCAPPEGGQPAPPGGQASPGSAAEAPEPSNRPPDIVVIVIDTLRADHLPFYGYSQKTAPFLSALAAAGVVFERTYSTSSWTAPATASLFTSVYPRQHGVVTGRAVTYQMSQRLNATLTLNRIPGELETLPEAMRRAGYRTYGVSDNFNICEQMGFAEGFDVFESDRQQYRGADHVNGVVRGWYPQLKSGGPYFLYIHYMEPHIPYHAQSPWYRPPAADASGRPAHLRDPERAQDVAMYDSEIALVDQRIRELYDLFAWDRNTLLVITSDHGEEFWDHGHYHHDKTLYDEVLRVPLLVRDPTGRFPPGRVGESVSLLDVLPTVAELAGVERDPRWMGSSLVPMMKGAQASGAHGRTLFAHLERHFFKPWGAHQTLRGVDGREHYVALAAMRGGWKLVVDSRENTLLFDREADPAESENLIEKQSEVAEELEAMLKEHAERMTTYGSETFQEELSSEEIERLRSLGYVQ